MFGLMKTPMKETPPPSDTMTLAELHVGCVVGFGFMLQKNISGRRVPVTEINSYIFDADSFISYRLEIDNNDMNLIVADPDEPGATQYLALSLRIEPRLFDLVFSSNLPKDWFSLEEEDEIEVKPVVLGMPPAWLTASYSVAVKTKGRYLEGDYRQRKGAERTRLSRPFDYVLLVDDNNEYALEAERYEDGTMNVFATVYRPATDIGEITRAPKSPFATVEIIPHIAPAAEAAKPAPSIVSPSPAEAVVEKPAVVIAETPAEALEVKPTVESHAEAPGELHVETAPQTLPEKLADVLKQTPVEAKSEPEAIEPRAKPETPAPVEAISPEASVTEVPVPERVVETPPRSFYLPQLPPVEMKVPEPAPVTDVPASHVLESDVEIPLAETIEAKAAEVEPVSAEAVALTEIVMETAPTESALSVEGVAIAEALPEAAPIVETASQEVIPPSAIAEPVAEEMALSETTALEKIEPETETTAHVESLPTLALILDSAAAEHTAETEPSVESVLAEIAVMPALEYPQTNATVMATAPLSHDNFTQDNVPGNITVLETPAAGTVAQPQDAPGTLACDIGLAGLLIEEAQRNQMRLSDVIRKVIDLPARVKDEVLIPFALENAELTLLAERYDLPATDEEGVKRHIIEELQRFLGEKK